jgi:AraC-like DNA-binding protein
VDPWFGASDPRRDVQLLELEALKRVVGAGGIVLYASSTGKGLNALRAIHPKEFPFLITQGIDDDPRSILRVLARSLVRRRIRTVFSADEDLSRLEAETIILEAVAGWPPPDTVQDLARELSASESTLRRTCKKVGIRSPRTLLRWSRALEAVALHSLGVRRRAQVAHVLGLAGSSSLVRLLRDLTGRPVGEILADASLEPMLDSFGCRIRSTSDSSPQGYLAPDERLSERPA